MRTKLDIVTSTVIFQKTVRDALRAALKKSKPVLHYEV